MDQQYQYVLKVAEELLYNACPKELIQKYEKLKQISLSKADSFGQSSTYFGSSQSDQFVNFNGGNQKSYSSTGQGCPLTNSSISNNHTDRFHQSLVDSLMETAGLFIDSIQARIYARNSRQFSAFEEMTSFVIDGLRTKAISLSKREQNQVISFEKLIQCMARALQEQDTAISIAETCTLQLRDSNSRFASFEENLTSKHRDELEKQKNLILLEKQKAIERITCSSEALQCEISELKTTHEELKKSYKRLEDELRLVLENERANEQVQENSDYFKRTFETVFAGFSCKYQEDFEEYAKNRREQYNIVENDETSCLYFLENLLDKFENDNSWLVERITEFGKENESLKILNADIFSQLNKLQLQQQLQPSLSQNSLKQAQFDGLRLALQREISNAQPVLNQYQQTKSSLQAFLQEEFNTLTV